MRLINGSHRRRFSSAPLLKCKREPRRTIVVDFYRIIKAIEGDRNLWLAKEMMEPREIAEALMEESYSPREYPDVMDFISDYVDESYPQIKNVIGDDTLDILCIKLEEYQRSFDDELSKLLKQAAGCYRYEVKKWIDRYSAILTVIPYNERM